MSNQKIEIRPCKFCGFIPKLFGREIRDYVDGEWAEKTRKEYWIQPFCWVGCEYGNMHANKFGVIGGTRYISEEAAIKAWNNIMED